MQVKTGVGRFPFMQMVCFWCPVYACRYHIWGNKFRACSRLYYSILDGISCTEIKRNVFFYVRIAVLLTRVVIRTGCEGGILDSNVSAPPSSESLSDSIHIVSSLARLCVVALKNVLKIFFFFIKWGGGVFLHMLVPAILHLLLTDRDLPVGRPYIHYLSTLRLRLLQLKPASFLHFG